MAKALIPAFAYLRTSSAANVGPDKDSDRRQREAIRQPVHLDEFLHRNRLWAPLKTNH
jgi:hypothetical protein